VLGQLIAVPATRRVRGLPTEVRLDPDDGMPDSCVLSLDNATLVPKPYFVERICTLGPERMDRVCRALAIATGCA
jgi:mRNA-degrading endonuclease toxin of MazEF toxin-antitoxin module